MRKVDIRVGGRMWWCRVLRLMYTTHAIQKGHFLQSHSETEGSLSKLRKIFENTN